MSEENIENEEFTEEAEKTELPEVVTNRLIRRVNGEPFATKKAAELRKGALETQGKHTRIVEVEGGYMLEVQSRAEATRGRKRIPLGVRQRLTAPKRKGYERRFVNDEGDRIKRFVDAGWTPVTGETLNIDNPERPEGIGDLRVDASKPLGSPIVETVDRTGKKAYLMEVPKEWFDEDYAARQKQIDELERNITARPNREGHYGAIKIK